MIHELGIKRLQYLVISGDIANKATEEEYQAAFRLVDGVMKRFGLDAERVLVVPGNHDLNWEDAEAAYIFTSKSKLPLTLPTGRHIPAGEAGTLLRDEALYRQRFARYAEHFHKEIYLGNEFPLDYSEQIVWRERPDDRILFLGLNSSWEIDHHFKTRASIHREALSRAVDRLNDGTYDGWLKIAVFHHPVSGKEMMDDAFLELLAVLGFHICLHGHIHEAKENFHPYDTRRGIYLVGAGTFGAPAKEQVAGIPLQYNLLSFNSETGEMLVKTRKKEKPDGAWSADARWGDKNEPKAQYPLNLAGYQAKR